MNTYFDTAVTVTRRINRIGSNNVITTEHKSEHKNLNVASV